MIASLMMYQRPELVGEHERFWALIRQELAERGIDSPETLSQDADEFDVWQSPELVLSQTCGMPYRLWLHDQVQLVGTTDYGLDGCPPGYYRSAIVVRADDSRSELGDYANAIFAYNQTFSQSGYAAPFGTCAELGFWFEERLQSHAHLESARMVAGGQADIASLDAMSWRLMLEYETFTSNLRVLAWTEPTPGLPLITGNVNDVGAVSEAVRTAMDLLDNQDRERLGLQGLVAIDRNDYLAVPNPPKHHIETPTSIHY